MRSFLRTETGSASILLAATVGALIWVNVSQSSYGSVWHTVLSIQIGGGGVAMDLRHWVNSGLMSFFFLVIGLEARREVLEALRVTSQKLNLAYEAVKSQSTSLTDAQSGA